MTTPCHGTERRVPLLGKRALTHEPLSADDWLSVHTLYRGFQQAVQDVVLRARRRAKELP